MEAKQVLATEHSSERSGQLEYLMRRFGDQVLRLAYYYVKDRHLAEDIAQEVFCRVYRHLDRFKHRASYYTWIHRITVNLCRDYLRSAAFKRLVPFGDAAALENIGGSTDSYLEAVEGGETFQTVMELPLKYRLVVALYYFHGFTTREIARITRMREGNVRVRLSRARQMLKEKLSGEEKNDR